MTKDVPHCSMHSKILWPSKGTQTEHPSKTNRINSQQSSWPKFWALFTSIPIDQALKVVKKKLKQDATWQQRTSLQAADILQLLELCLNTTYFTYNHK